MSFRFNEGHMRRLCRINGFPVKEEGMYLFGLRGCLPADVDDSGFGVEHDLRLTEIDYTHPRCTIGQWLPKEGKIALFPGSTVPHIRYVKSSKERNGDGANQLMTGFYGDYRKGVHKSGSPTAHSAFRQTEAHPVRRTADDFDFDNDDRVEFTNPYDNIHAAWSMGINHDEYASAGCQVIVGFPRCEKRGKNADAGPWKVFHENAYAISQESFPYILLTGLDAQGVALSGGQEKTARLRFGSQGETVAELQRRLREAGFYEGNIDTSFGTRTIRALLAYQSATFGPNADDGIVGPITASALGMALPKL